MRVRTFSMAVNLFCIVLLGTFGLGDSFLVAGGLCNHDNDCGLGLCDRDNHCRCYVGWTGLRCSISDTHANLAGLCDHFHCGNHGNCHQGSKCVCDKGWHGYICDIPDHGHSEILPEATTVSHSSGAQCGHHYCYHGYCQDAYHSRCQCDKGWFGFDCTHNVAPHCGSSQCYHGDCHFSNCECHPGWTGRECETALHVYECNGQPCHNGNCEWAPYHHQICKCFDGWTGQDCATKEAVSWQYCGNDRCYNGECHRQFYYNVYKCICHRGWTGHRCTEPATLSPCNGVDCYHGTCHSDVNHSESYCVCDVGWTQRDCNTREVSTFTQPPTVQTQAPTTAPTTTPSLTTKIHVTSTPTLTSSTTTRPTSTRLPNTPSTTTTEGTTASPLHAAVCAKFGTVSAISNAKVSSNPNAISCASGNRTSPEAFVLEHCNVTSPSTWKEGVNIMANCKSLPLYTPIASFASHHYSSAGTLCGVLIGCLQDGFQMVVQYCDQPPVIEHVITNNGSFALDPSTYYTIMI